MRVSVKGRANYRAKTCTSCGVSGRHQARGLCDTCYRDDLLKNSPETLQRYKINARDKQLQKDFGISLAEYGTMFEAQMGRCAICATTETGSPTHGHFAVDHDHDTGQVRGLLCIKCNMAIGLLLDSSDLAVKAALYLKRYGK